MTADPAPWIRELQARTRGPVRAQLSPDFDVTLPVEVFDARGPGYVSPEDLGLSEALTSDLLCWQQTYEECYAWDDLMGGDDEGDGGAARDPDPDSQAWAAEGHRLLERLRAELGPGFSVRWV